MGQAAHPPGFVTAGDRPPTLPAPGRRRLPLHARISIGMLAGMILGAAANLLFGDSPALRSFIDNVSYPTGQVFLRLIFLVVIPLVVSVLILGVAASGDVRRSWRS